MNENKYKKLSCILLYLAFAGVSCWATAESLHLLMSGFPIVMCWIVTIGFFIVASIGTKLIVDSLNKNLYIEKRNLKLSMGLLIVLFFWLVCSMPTNTHTFFYRQVVADVTTADLATTKNYLTDIRDNKKSLNDYQMDVEKITRQVNSKLIDLEAEIDNPSNIGDGPKAKEILYEISQLLRCKPIATLSGTATTPQQRQARKAAYRTIVQNQLESYIADLAKSADGRTSGDSKLAANSIKQIAQMQNVITDMKNQGCVDNDKIMQSDVVMQNGYAIIKNNSSAVNFQGQDEQVYNADPLVTKTHRLLSVFDVWKDWLTTDKYDGHGFIFWVILSILVDVGAFIFFDLAFKKQD